MPVHRIRQVFIHDPRLPAELLSNSPQGQSSVRGFEAHMG
ncbi:PaaX family transcriptional regulator C-terminal domain-containing protein [Nonomuraea sp. NPDC049158]